MNNYVKLALDSTQKKGMNPTLAELIEQAEYMRSRDVRTARMLADCALKDFIDSAEDVLKRAEQCGDDAEIYGTLTRMANVARKAVKEDD